MKTRFGGPVPLNQGGSAESKLTEGVPLARIIPRTFSEDAEIVMLSAGRSVAAEKFRRLKTLLSNDAEPAQVVVITSARPSEGKSVIAANLALALAADQRGEILLVDGDLRRPTVEHWLRPHPQLGLSEVLAGKAALEHAVLDMKNTPLKVLPAGTPPADPVEIISSERAASVFAGLRERYQRIVIDTPPIVPFTDADIFGRLGDGVLLVVRVGTPQAGLLQAVEAVTNARILGVVLNDATFNFLDRHSYYAKDYYARYYERERK